MATMFVVAVCFLSFIGRTTSKGAESHSHEEVVHQRTINVKPIVKTYSWYSTPNSGEDKTVSAAGDSDNEVEVSHHHIIHIRPVRKIIIWQSTFDNSNTFKRVNGANGSRTMSIAGDSNTKVVLTPNTVQVKPVLKPISLNRTSNNVKPTTTIQQNRGSYGKYFYGLRLFHPMGHPKSHENLNMGNMENCVNKCQRQAGCTASLHDPNNRYGRDCFLYFGTYNAGWERGWIAWIKAPRSQDQNRGDGYYSGMRLKGFDTLDGWVPVLKLNAAACAEMCRQRADCWATTFNNLRCFWYTKRFRIDRENGWETWIKEPYTKG